MCMRDREDPFSSDIDPECQHVQEGFVECMHAVDQDDLDALKKSLGLQGIVMCIGNLGEIERRLIALSLIHI